MRKIGILLAQLGTPDAPTAKALRRYLRQFLGDPRVIELNRVLWWLILNGIVLVTRPKNSAKLYQKIWTPEGSPLLVVSQSQARKLDEELQREHNDKFEVVLGMRYGQPAIPSALDALCRKGVDGILVFPMYPQYAAATTASTYDEVFKYLPQRRYVPALRVAQPYFEHPAYIKALADSVRESLAQLTWQPEKILISFHGIPQRYADNGDPYPQHCEATVRNLAQALAWKASDYIMSYQSRFGKEVWLRPYTDVTLGELGKQGLKRIAALCPGFTTDCLETIDEIGNLGEEQFRATGGEQLHLIPCLNDSDRWIQAMKTIALQESAGWI
jgi:ferrochelatase